MKESDSLVIPAEAGIQEAVISSKARNFQFPNSITIFDYHGVLSKTGWKVTHRIECPPAQLNGVPFQGVQPGCPQNA